MPNKTIYMSESDRELYDRAAELGGGLSPAIAEALGEWVARHDTESDGFRTITVQVSADGGTKEKRFTGRQLVKITAQQDGTSRVYTVYATQREQYAVHIQPAQGFAGIAAEIQNMFNNSGDWFQQMQRNAREWRDRAEWRDRGDGCHPFAGRNPLEGLSMPFSEDGDSSLRVFATIDSMIGEIPDEVRSAVRDAEREPQVEDLDI